LAAIIRLTPDLIINLYFTDFWVIFQFMTHYLLRLTYLLHYLSLGVTFNLEPLKLTLIVNVFNELIHLTFIP